jgi:hypothetical protein
MNKILGITRANASFAVAYFASFAFLLWIRPTEPIVLLCWIFLMIVWAMVVQWWIVAGLLIGSILPGPGEILLMLFGVFCGFLIETAIWGHRKRAGFWRDFFFPQ